MTQLAGHVNIRLISLLIKNISRVFQKLLRYFRDMAISTSLALPVTGMCHVIIALNLNNSEYVTGSLGTSFGYCQKLSVFA